jgi:hypothetical protein
MSKTSSSFAVAAWRALIAVLGARGSAAAPARPLYDGRHRASIAQSRAVTGALLSGDCGATWRGCDFATAGQRVNSWGPRWSAVARSRGLPASGREVHNWGSPPQVGWRWWNVVRAGPRRAVSCGAPRRSTAAGRLHRLHSPTGSVRAVTPLSAAPPARNSSLPCSRAPSQTALVPQNMCVSQAHESIPHKCVLNPSSSGPTPVTILGRRFGTSNQRGAHPSTRPLRLPLRPARPPCPPTLPIHPALLPLKPRAPACLPPPLRRASVSCR